MLGIMPFDSIAIRANRLIDCLTTYLANIKQITTDWHE